jgi:hypothetical protein
MQRNAPLSYQLVHFHGAMYSDIPGDGFDVSRHGRHFVSVVML